MHPSNSFFRVLPGLAAFLATSAFVDIALACGGPRCELTEMAPSDGATVPTNVAGLPFRAFEGVPSDGGASLVRLFDATDTEIPTSVQELGNDLSLLVPNTPLPEGTGYRLKFSESCGESDRTFDVGPQTPLPTEIGSLVGATYPTKVVDTSYGDACITEIEDPEQGGTLLAVAAELTLTPSPELLAFASVTEFTIRVDDGHPERKKLGSARITGSAHDKLVLGKLFWRCDPNAPSAKDVTTTIHVGAHVAGATTDPPDVSTTLTYACPVRDAATGSESDGGATLPGDSQRPNGASNSASPNGSSDDSGCSVSRDPSNAWGQIGAFFAGLALVVSARSVFRRRTR